MKRISKVMLASVSLLAFSPTALLAQTKADAASNDEQASAEEIVVTGTSRSRISLDTPLAVSQVSAGALARAGVSSQADILNTIPTIKADGGGGEVASNVFVKGLSPTLTWVTRCRWVNRLSGSA